MSDVDYRDVVISGNVNSEELLRCGAVSKLVSKFSVPLIHLLILALSVHVYV